MYFKLVDNAYVALQKVVTDAPFSRLFLKLLSLEMIK